jgi:pimeloyl-ACP methyl ester carboxylesterase
VVVFTLKSMLTVREHDIELTDGRTLHYYDTLADDGTEPALAVFWLHGSPNLGEPPAPLFAAAQARGLRWVSYDRPAYGGSTEQTGRDVAAAAHDVAAVARALGLDRFAVLGHSGGGPHALACAALLPDQVAAAVSISGLAPYGADGLDYFAGMGVEAELKAAIEGRAELEHELAIGEFDPETFTPADHAALEGEWSWLNGVVVKALEQGLTGLIDDDLASVRPWGFDLAQIKVPVLLVHGEEDRMVPAAHASWLAEHVPDAELRLSPGVGHVAVLSTEGDKALEWLRECAT